MLPGSQIVVPVDLADVLRAFSKEVIRQQPADVLLFASKCVHATQPRQTAAHRAWCASPCMLTLCACRYFAGLAARAALLTRVTAPPSRQQLASAFAALADSPPAPLAELEAAASAAAGIPANTLRAVAAAARLDASAPLRCHELLLLLLAMSCDGLTATLKGFFEVFSSSGGSSGGGDGVSAQVLGVPLLLELLAILAQRDSSVSAELVQQVAGALAGQASVDYSGLAAIPALAQRLRA